MKKVLMQLMAILLVTNLAYSQKKKNWENPCPECLPGVSYGFEWPVFPPITDPDPSTPPEILQWTNDLSVIMFQIGEIYQENGKPYFTVKYNIAVNNLSGQGPLNFHLKLSQRYNPLTPVVLDQSVSNLPNKFYQIKNLSVNSPKIFEDTIHVLYPFYKINRGGSSKYLKIPVDITAEIPNTGFRSNNHIVVVTDPNMENNKTKITLVTPIPLSYTYRKPNIN